MSNPNSQPFTENPDGDVIVPPEAGTYTPYDEDANEEELGEIHPEFAQPVDPQAVLKAMRDRLGQSPETGSGPEPDIHNLRPKDRGATAAYVKNREDVLGGGKKPRDRRR